MSEWKTIEERMYDESFRGLSFTETLVDVVGEADVEIDGEIKEMYLYNIVGYEPENKKHFMSLKLNILELD